MKTYSVCVCVCVCTGTLCSLSHTCTHTHSPRGAKEDGKKTSEIERERFFLFSRMHTTSTVLHVLYLHKESTSKYLI